MRFKHYKPVKLVRGKYYGFLVEIHSTRRGVDIWVGKHLFVFWAGNQYK